MSSPHALQTSGPQPLLAAAVLTISGFDAARGLHQAEGVFTNMRLLASWVPGCLMFFALVALVRYPLTRERMLEFKANMSQRRSATSA